jgi:hypothetical protein
MSYEPMDFTTEAQRAQRTTLFLFSSCPSCLRGKEPSSARRSAYLWLFTTKTRRARRSRRTAYWLVLSVNLCALCASMVIFGICSVPESNIPGSTGPSRRRGMARLTPFPRTLRCRPMPPQTLLVLVIDDEPQIRRVVRNAFKDNGTRVLEAATGAEGIDSPRRSIPISSSWTWGCPTSSAPTSAGKSASGRPLPFWSSPPAIPIRRK